MGGSITVVGIGPGSLQHITWAARDAIEQADIILGYKTYLQLIAELVPHVPREQSGMRQEVNRVNRAIALAREGKQVTIISSGDAGIYGMAGLVYEVLREQDEDGIPVEVIPGVSALNAAAALLGAPLMTDFAAISLSDLLTPLDDIMRRVEMATQADFVLCLYNPQGRNRTEPFQRTWEIVSRHRMPETPVGIVRSAYRKDQRIELTTLNHLPEADIDMTTLVVIGNSRTYVYNGKMVTPRGYGTKYRLSGDA